MGTGGVTQSGALLRCHAGGGAPASGDQSADGRHLSVLILAPHTSQAGPKPSARFLLGQRHRCGAGVCRAASVSKQHPDRRESSPSAARHGCPAEAHGPAARRCPATAPPGRHAAAAHHVSDKKGPDQHLLQAARGAAVGGGVRRRRRPAGERQCRHHRPACVMPHPPALGNNVPHRSVAAPPRSSMTPGPRCCC